MLPVPRLRCSLTETAFAPIADFTAKPTNTALWKNTCHQPSAVHPMERRQIPQMGRKDRHIYAYCNLCHPQRLQGGTAGIQSLYGNFETVGQVFTGAIGECLQEGTDLYTTPLTQEHTSYPFFRTGQDKMEENTPASSDSSVKYGFTRGAEYYGGKK